MADLTADRVITLCGQLKRKWVTRNAKFIGWHNLLTLKDELEQEGMESVTSNDPRTAYNLALHLLTSSIISHRIPTEDLKAEEIAATSYLESYVTKNWVRLENQYRNMGRQSWLRELVGLMLAFGWYAVIVLADDDRLIAEVCHPADVFPDFGDDLSQCAHIYPLSPSAANRKAKVNRWVITENFIGNTTLYNYWFYDADGDVANATVLGRNYVKPATKHPELKRIPIFISPVSGLQDRGSIAGGNEWQNYYGESILAGAEGVILNYNKMLSFSQQLMRDTANPKWFEQSRGDTPILTEEALRKYGSIFRGSPEDQIGPLQVPPIPVELRTSLFEFQNMIQRKLFPWILYGNIQQQITGYAMSQIASSALQVLTPYHNAIKGLLSDIDNFWWEQIRDNKYSPYKFKRPPNLPPDVEFDVGFNINIPGYLTQRATVARMLDPTFRLSTSTVMDMEFPEIKDAIKEQARARRDEAMLHPKAIMVDQIIAYKEQARVLRDAGDDDGAALYEKLAKSMEDELTAPTPQEKAAMAPPPIPREVMPKEAMLPGEGMGRIT